MDNFKGKQFFGTNSVFFIFTHNVIVYLAVLALDLDFHKVIRIMFLGLDVNKFFTVLNLHKSCNKIKINRIFNFFDLLKLCYFILATLIRFLSNSPNSFYSKKDFEKSTLNLNFSFKFYCNNQCQFFKGLLNFIYFRSIICFELNF